MSARTLPTNASNSQWQRQDTAQIVTDHTANGSGSYTIWADGSIWDVTNSKYIKPEDTQYQAYLSTPRS
jgi:hypothetical protein